MVLESKNLTQAVLICDNFDNEFEPIQSEQPLALLKIVNRSIIDHTLTFLKTNGIEQVIIFSSKARRLKEHLLERKWIKESDEVPFAIVSASDNLSSLGDVMRDVFNNNLVKNDFVLINGNLIGSSFPLLRYMREHIERRKNHDKGSIMTMLYMKLSHDHRSRSPDDRSILVVNKNTQKLLFYDTLANMSKKRKIDLNLELFQTNSNLKIQFDLQDTSVAICSTAVPQLFADNFDYNTKDDFIHSILVHEDILMNTIYVNTLDDDAYARKVYDAFSYDAISRDIVERWSFPTVPDLQEDLCYHRHNIYKSLSVDLKIDSVLGQNLVIGKNSTVDSGAQISRSVIGENCRIGKNVHLNGCYLMDNVVIGDNCKVTQCILSNNVIIKNNCELQPGCLVGKNCVLGPDLCLPRCTLLQATSEFEDAQLDTKLVGNEGRAYLYRTEEEEEDEEECDEIKKRAYWGQECDKKLQEYDCSSDNASHSSDDELDDGQFEDDDDEFDDEYKKFYDEVIDSLQRGFHEKIECKNLILEINCSKHAYNIPIKDVVCLVIKAILELPKFMDKNLNDETQYYAKFQNVLKYCLLMFQNYVKSSESQKDCLLTLENFTLKNSTLFSATNFVRVLKVLYAKEILSEEWILKWSQTSTLSFPATLQQTSLDQVNESERKKLRSNKMLLEFIDWLNEAEEESSEDDDE